MKEIWLRYRWKGDDMTFLSLMNSWKHSDLFEGRRTDTSSLLFTDVNLIWVGIVKDFA